ncbi:hypothetical protein DF122_37585 [Burkholderia pseudomallei]|nr:hypothetical protein BOC35_33205 [Burkholderia pseudomallei]ARK77678.1 hypothetical protein BOC39_30685 [Burkholderia pseudomallei]ARL21632.1 hypothetical protein BOC47_03630 [Burkholderia pseudomallei]ARL31455.1 hypothetical protein BOC48_20445 [Burkholderia pseudomallei]ARL37436.1 hypothetical protein BOC49_15215 [Burkholderia pseudomallei]
MFATLLTYQTHCALPDFRGELGCLLVHGSILSRIRASTKFGAVHPFAEGGSWCFPGCVSSFWDL